VAFGWVTALIALSVAFGNIINSKFVTKFGREKMIDTGIFIMFIGTITMLIFAFFKFLNLYVILGPMLLVVFSIGLIAANVVSKALDPFQKSAGTAAALYGGLQMFVYSAWSALAALFHTKNQWPLALLLFTIPVIVSIFIWLEKNEYSFKKHI
jgi:DHA1 family bicyclomycin/chloramphenicol resistance-like MFS transporter